MDNTSNNDDLHLAKPGSFFGVYILYSLNVKHKGKIYIGFTVNPERRIRQHNREIKGGASKTGRNNGPWDMVLIIHGFHTRLAALQFEWAWQNPQRSRRLSYLPKKLPKENVFTYRLRILSEMLNTGPWCRLPLTIQWLKQEYVCQFPVQRPPPLQMPIAYGQIRTVKKTNNEKSSEEQIELCDDFIEKEIVVAVQCALCKVEEKSTSVNNMLSCIVRGCTHVAHINCLAQLFLAQADDNDRYLIPVNGTCPGCEQNLLWGDILKQKKYAMDIEFSEDDPDRESSTDDDEFQ